MVFVSILAGSGIGLGVMIILALLVRREANYRANRLLAGSLLCFVCYLTAIISLQLGWVESLPMLASLALIYPMCPPLLYGYVRLMTEPDFHLSTRSLFHLWPLLVLVFVLVFGVPSANTEALDEARGGWPPNRAALVGILNYLAAVIYLIPSLLLVRRHQRTVGDSFSYEENVTLRWLRVLISLYLLLAMIGLLLALARLLPGVELWPRSIYSTSMITVICYLIGFFAIAQPEVFEQKMEVPEEALPEAESARYETSALTEAEQVAHWNRLCIFMKDEEPYLDNELRVADLAAKLGMPASHLSQTINQQASMNFFEFVSNYRVDRATQLLKAPDANVTQVAMASGFNSQSAFYRQFKKSTGLTPKQFQRQQAGPESVNQS